jgi:hypothetical protein
MKTLRFKFSSTAVGMQDVARRRIAEDNGATVTIEHKTRNPLEGVLVVVTSDEGKVKKYIAEHPVFKNFFQ